MNKLLLAQEQKTSVRITPRTLLGTNLLFVPLAELTDECRRLLGDNPFISFAPPRWQAAGGGLDDEAVDAIPAAVDLDSHLALQIATCPGLPAGFAAEPSFWSSLLDERGYLNTRPEDVAVLLAADPAKVQAALAALKKYVEPAGLFASSLQECCALQLSRLGGDGRDAAMLVCEGWTELAAGRGLAFARARGWSRERYEAALRVVRSLDPSPGKNFHTAASTIPEVEFRAEGGSVSVRLICVNLPAPENCFGDFPVAAGELLCQRWAAPVWSRAKFVLDRLGLRYRTLLRISLLAAEVQRKYLCGEARAAEPLTYTEAAASLSLSVSTVGRAVKDVWCLWRGGSLPLSSFFSRQVSARPDRSVRALRLEIAALNSRGFSDSAIAARLQLPVRTVSYHRAALGLRSSKRRGSPAP